MPFTYIDDFDYAFSTQFLKKIKKILKKFFEKDFCQFFTHYIMFCKKKQIPHCHGNGGSGCG